MSILSPAAWPELPLAGWRETYETLHLWTQIVGKIRLARAPWLNHSWHVALYVTARGLTTSPIPDGAGTFQIDFDFIDHELADFDQRRPQRQFTLAGQFGRELLRGRLWLRSPSSALTSPSTRCRTNCPSRSGSRRMTSTPPTIPMRCGASSRSLSMPTASSSNSAPAFSARRARCISSGAVSISR